ncbi:uncharacterized protein LOC102097394 isoform X1 [Columba livia]|uniref:uncharacterized protein LOC102097394 isoform X1 n=1 Tax=Columba livia TaxID=8932 RepID=UPI0031BAFBAB
MSAMKITGAFVLLALAVLCLANAAKENEIPTHVPRDFNFSLAMLECLSWSQPLKEMTHRAIKILTQPSRDKLCGGPVDSNREWRTHTELLPYQHNIYSL